MDEINLDSFEKSILSDIKGIKPKSKKRGYAKELIKKLYPGIEQALANGCSFEEVAATISNNKVKISPSTLKRYHSANKASKHEVIPSTTLNVEKNKKVNSKSSSTSFSKENNSQNFQKNAALSKAKSESAVKAVIEEERPRQTTPHLTGASMTDEDYLDDFNDY